MSRLYFFATKIYEWACNRNRHGNFAHDWRIEKHTKENEIPNEQTREQLAAVNKLRGRMSKRANSEIMDPCKGTLSAKEKRTTPETH